MSERTETLKQHILDVRSLVPRLLDVPAMLSYWVDEFETSVRQDEREKHPEPKNSVNAAIAAITLWAHAYMNDTRELDLLVSKLSTEVRLQDHVWHEQGLERINKDIMLLAQQAAYWKSAFALSTKDINILGALGPEPKEPIC